MKIYFVLCLFIIATHILAQTHTNGIYISDAIISQHLNPPPPPPFDGKTPPPIKLGEAYKKMLSSLGDTTNQYYCVSATCLNSLPSVYIGSTGEYHQGWTFTLSSSNGISKNVYIYFDKANTVFIEEPMRHEYSF
jgi:hypothetical protein